MSTDPTARAVVKRMLEIGQELDDCRQVFGGRLRELGSELMELAEEFQHEFPDNDSSMRRRRPPPPPPEPPQQHPRDPRTLMNQPPSDMPQEPEEPTPAMQYAYLWTDVAPCGDKRWHGLHKERKTEQNVVYAFFAACSAECQVCVRNLLNSKMSPIVVSDSGQFTPLGWATWVRDQRHEKGTTVIMDMLQKAIDEELKDSEEADYAVVRQPQQGSSGSNMP